MDVFCYFDGVSFWSVFVFGVSLCDEKVIFDVYVYRAWRLVTEVFKVTGDLSFDEVMWVYMV